MVLIMGAPWAWRRVGKTAVNFAPIVHPFTPTERFQEHLRQYLFEYAAFGRETLQWPEDFTGWRITDKFDEEAGFVWLRKGPDAPDDERLILIAIYDEFQRRRFADAALRFVESRLASLGIKKLKGQVNTNKAGTGRFVRAWLLKHGFRPIRRKEHGEFAHLSDDVYAASCPKALKFEKTYEHGESAEAEGLEDMDDEHYPPVIGSGIIGTMRRQQRDARARR